MAKARIERIKGVPTVVVDGAPLPPMSATVWGRAAPAPGRPPLSRDERHAYLRDLRAAGIRVFYLSALTRWPTLANEGPWRPAGEEVCADGLQALLDDLDFLLGSVPDAYVMIRLDVSPSRDWVNAHPGEQVRFSDGSHRPAVCSTVGRRPLDGMFSLCSEAWRTEVEKGLADYFGELRRHPQFAHVIGVFLCSGGTSEWYYPIRLETDDGAYADFSDPFRRHFASYLREKYGTEERLRQAWGMPDATFDAPAIPAIADRRYIEAADRDIRREIASFQAGYPTPGAKPDFSPAAGPNIGVFLNANARRHVADFYDAWNDATAETILRFARRMKALCPDLLVGAFYGAYGCNDFFTSSTATGTLKILDAGVVDFLAAPGVYNDRGPGGVVAQREMQDSFRLRNRVFIAEDDARTHLSEPWIQRDGAALYTVRDALDTLKRDFARNICEDIRGWWFDMGCGWYRDPDILALFRRQQEIAALAYSLDRTKRTEIALVFDVESVHLASLDTSRLAVDLYRTSDLARIGAPVDYYFHDDLARPDMPDYRLYVMLNQYSLTDAEREAVYAKARRNGAVILWLYAPGLVNPDAPVPMALENVERTVGMRLGYYDTAVSPYFHVDPASHPAVAKASASRRYGFLGREVKSSYWVMADVMPAPYLKPGFYIDDPGATVLGRYCVDGRPALAMVERDGVRSVYCAARVVAWDLLASLAAFAGCHLFGDRGDVLYANESFVAVHADGDGRRTIRFKRPCSPYEVYEKRFYGNGIEKIDVAMRHGQTLMWSLGELAGA
ncbi:MAG: hypothetical protein IJQ73_13115 [Kiritimatiellae bacterium]|nr:hypothetical protein [Kiritimatiellia bacterium]